MAAAEASSIAGASSQRNREVHQGESFGSVLMPTSFFEWIARGLLVGVGLFAGFFYVPLAVFMQVRPPADLKGRMIGAMNLVNWIGILVAAVFYGAAEYLCGHVWQVRQSWIFGVSALVMLPVALFYRPNIRMANRVA
jgi:acyl-[acyl-carrier-protein]-phospholipid O-acyltransferase/long-chain-fatty-acid--[acyl-carrier-protein] ligase